MPGGPSTATDAELVTRFAEAGSQESFAELVSRHWPLVFQVGRRVTRNHSDAEDIAQATFLALSDATREGRHREIANVIGWLHRVATHLACHRRDAIRARERHEAGAAAARERAAHEQHAALEEAASSEVDQALERIPERYRIALVRHYLRGESIAEIASACATTDGTVASWLSRGRKLLQSQLPTGGVASVALVALTVHEPIAPPLAEAMRTLSGADGAQPAPAVRQLALEARAAPGAGPAVAAHAVAALALTVAVLLAATAWAAARANSLSDAHAGRQSVAAEPASTAPSAIADRYQLPLTTISATGGIGPDHAADVESALHGLPALAVGGVPADCLEEATRCRGLDLEEAPLTRLRLDASQMNITRFLRDDIVGRVHGGALAPGSEIMAVLSKRLPHGQEIQVCAIARTGRVIRISWAVGQAIAGSAAAEAPDHVTAIACWLGRLEPGSWSVVADSLGEAGLTQEEASLTVQVPSAMEQPAVAATVLAWRFLSHPAVSPAPPTAAWIAEANDRVLGSEVQTTRAGIVAAGALTDPVGALLSAGQAEAPGMVPLSLPERPDGPCDTAIFIAGSAQSCATLLCMGGPARWSSPAEVQHPNPEWIDPRPAAAEPRAPLVLDLPKAAHPLRILLSVTRLQRLGAGRDFAPIAGEQWTDRLDLP